MSVLFVDHGNNSYTVNKHKLYARISGIQNISEVTCTNIHCRSNMCQHIRQCFWICATIYFSYGCL